MRITNLSTLAEEIIAGANLKPEDDVSLLLEAPLAEVQSAAGEVQRAFCGKHVDLCTILNGRSGRCSEEIERVSGMIRSYVENDPTAFYTVDEFDAAVSTLKSFCEKRAESIGRQLDGKLGSTADSQKSEEKVDASDLTLSKMGTQGGGKDGEGGPGGPGGQPGGAPPSREGQPQTTAPSE